MTEAGAIVKPARVAGVIDRTAVFEVTPRVAVIVAETSESTPMVATVNCAESAPEGTTTVAGTNALALFDERFTDVPPIGAGAERVTVPVVEFPP